jgi:glycosyltransferase involved in cell wall biosynthesis
VRVRTGDSYFVPFVVDLGQRNAHFVKRDVSPLLSRLHWRIQRLLPPPLVWMASYAATVLVPEPDYEYDLIHLVNVIPLLPRRPFVVTFEDFMPRVPEDRYIGWLQAWLRRRLQSPRCLAVVAMSEYARRQFEWQHRGYRDLPALARKLRTIYPAVPLGRREPKPPSGGLSLLFVGRQFMRKGAPAVIRAHERLARMGIPVRTTMVSSLEWSQDDYVGPPAAAYVERERARLGAVSGLTRIPGLSNREILELMERADYLIAPTLHDTFGFASIEALSVATPVIATSTCAQPEIVEHGRSGYLLPFDNDADVGKWRWLYRTREPGYLEAFDGTIERLAETLTERLAECWERRSEYEALSAGALARAQTRFDRGTARQRLEAIYEEGRLGDDGRRGPLRNTS